METMIIVEILQKNCQEQDLDNFLCAEFVDAVSINIFNDTNGNVLYAEVILDSKAAAEDVILDFNDIFFQGRPLILNLESS